MVNPGAMAAAELVKGGTSDGRTSTMLGVMSRFAGRSRLVGEDVFHSDQATGHHKRTIAFMMLN